MSISEPTPDNLSSVLFAVEELLKKREFPLIGRLKPGLNDNEIAGQLQSIDLVFPPDLLHMYKWRDGTDDADYLVGSSSDIFSHGYLMSLEVAIWNYSFMIKEELWSRTFFPIVTNGGGDFLLYNLLDGQIYYYGPPVLLQSSPMSIFDSLFSMFKTIETSYAQGVYEIQNGSFLEVDSTLESQIAASLNPVSEFYKS